MDPSFPEFCGVNAWRIFLTKNVSSEGNLGTHNRIERSVSMRQLILSDHLSLIFLLGCPPASVSEQSHHFAPERLECSFQGFKILS